MGWWWTWKSQKVVQIKVQKPILGLKWPLNDHQTHHCNTWIQYLWGFSSLSSSVIFIVFIFKISLVRSSAALQSCVVVDVWHLVCSICVATKISSVSSSSIDGMRINNFLEVRLNTRRTYTSFWLVWIFITFVLPSVLCIILQVLRKALLLVWRCFSS